MARKPKSTKPDWPRYLKWRDGRPRWEPGPALRVLGFRGQDLKDAAGGWLGLEAAIDAAAALNEKADAVRKAGPDSPQGAWRAGGPTGKQTITGKVGVLRRTRTLEDLWVEWSTHAPRARKAAPRTLADYKNKLFCLPDDIRTAPVAALTKPIMVGLYERLHAARGHSMANGIMAVVRRLLTYAENKGWIVANPARQLEIEALPPRLRLITPAEATAIVAAADAITESPYGALASVGDAFMLALHSAQREGDCLAMPARILGDNRLRLSQIKTRAMIDAPLTAALRVRLKAALQRQKEAGRVPDSLVMRDDGRTWTLDDGTAFRKAFAIVRKAAAEGIVDQDASARAAAAGHNEPVWTLPPCPSIAGVLDEAETAKTGKPVWALLPVQFKDTRDTAVTRLGHAGCSVPEIGAISGHSLKTIHTVLRHYMVTTPQLADGAIRRLVTWLDQEGISV